MSPAQKRIKLAEAAGWTKIREQDYDHGYSGDDIRQFWVGLSPNTGDMEQIPDYFNDLNAVHEAENWLKKHHPDLTHHYLRGLIHIVDLEGDYYLCATAAQRAEAFLRTLNLWTS